jgi:hypothetical protein
MSLVMWMSQRLHLLGPPTAGGRGGGAYLKKTQLLRHVDGHVDEIK